MSLQQITSERFQLVAIEWKKWLKNQRVFLAPLGLMYVVFVTAGIKADGIQPTDFIPTNEVLSGAALFVLNAAWDLLRKWGGEETYIIKK